MDQSDLDLLQTVPAYHMQSVIKARHLPLSPLALNSAPATPAASSSPTAATLEIARYLFVASAIADVLRELSELETLILRELAACGGRANSRDLALYFASIGQLTAPGKTAPDNVSDSPRSHLPTMPLQPPQYPPAHPHGPFEQALRRLLLFGLLFWGRQTNFAGRDYTSGIHDGVLVVPVAVREVVRQEWRLDEELLARDDADVGEGVRALQRDLYLYWSLVAAQREGLALVNNGLLARSALRLVVEGLGVRGQGEQVRTESEAPRLLFLRLLLMKLDLLQERHTALFAAPSESFFALSLLERARCCYQLYLDTPFWNELLYLPEVNVRPTPPPFEPAHEETMHARQTLLERLKREQVNTWHELVAFIARTKLYVPYLLFPRQYGPRAERYSSNSNPYGYDFRLRRGWLTHREGWHMVEGGFVRAVVAGPLHWLGLVELDRDENPALFRISPGTGSVISAVAPQSAAAPWGRLIVQPNFELVVLAPASEALLVRLDRFAERISLEHVAQYRLTRASVTRAIQRGLHAEDIQAVLEQAAGGEIPQNVRYSLLEWERQARRVEVWQNATLLEVADTSLLDGLFDDPETRKLLGRRLTPHLAEVAVYRLPLIQELLWRRNFLPALSSAPERETALDGSPLVHREPQWRLHDDGLLQPFYAVLDLYLVAEVERFTERDEATSWYRLTPSSLQRALGQGLSLQHIMHFLQHYCEDGVPASLVIRLKLWGGGYEDQQEIHVEHAPLLRLSQAILQDVQADTELNALLGSEVEQDSRLIHVASDNLERVLALLRERGFTVE